MLNFMGEPSIHNRPDINLMAFLNFDGLQHRDKPNGHPLLLAPSSSQGWTVKYVYINGKVCVLHSLSSLGWTVNEANCIYGINMAEVACRSASACLWFQLNAKPCCVNHKLLLDIHRTA